MCVDDGRVRRGITADGTNGGIVNHDLKGSGKDGNVKGPDAEKGWGSHLLFSGVDKEHVF